MSWRQAEGGESGGFRLPKPISGFFTMDGATHWKFLDLAKFACRRGRVGMLVSNPFRDIGRDSRSILLLWRAGDCNTPPAQSKASDFNSIASGKEFARASRRRISVVCFAFDLAFSGTGCCRTLVRFAYSLFSSSVWIAGERELFGGKVGRRQERVIDDVLSSSAGGCPEPVGSDSGRA